MVLLVYYYVTINTRKDYIMNYETLNKEEFDKVLHGNSLTKYYGCEIYEIVLGIC